MQAHFDNHLPPCLWLITSDYLSGTREHWTTIFTVHVLPDINIRKVHALRDRTARLNSPRNVHDRKHRLMCEVNFSGNSCKRIEIPSCRQLPSVSERYLRVRLSYHRGNIDDSELWASLRRLVPYGSMNRAALTWDYLKQHLNESELYSMLMEHETFSAYWCPVWAVGPQKEDEYGLPHGWWVKVRGEDKWMSALKHSRKEAWKSYFLDRPSWHPH